MTTESWIRRRTRDNPSLTFKPVQHQGRIVDLERFAAGYRPSTRLRAVFVQRHLTQSQVGNWQLRGRLRQRGALPKCQRHIYAYGVEQMAAY